jgi:hypothetical protein
MYILRTYSAGEKKAAPRDTKFDSKRECLEAIQKLPVDSINRLYDDKGNRMYSVALKKP